MIQQNKTITTSLFSIEHVLVAVAEDSTFKLMAAYNMKRRHALTTQHRA
jgi:hypothetical protein